MNGRWNSPYTLGVAGAVLAVALWLWLSWDSTNLFFPPLRQMVGDATSYWLSSDGLRDLYSTLRNLARGLAIGVLLGIGLGLLIGQVRLLDLALTPLVEFTRSIPSVALLPFAIALFGVGDAMQVFSIALSSLWPVLINTVDGTRLIPPLWHDTATIFGFTRFQRQLNVLLPALAPRILAGVHIAVPLSLIVAVTSEMVGTTAGIGSVILNAQSTFDAQRMWSGVLVLAVIGFLMNGACALLERAVLRRYSPIQVNG